MSDLDLCYMTASQAMARFKARTLSPVELLEALIERAEEVEPKVNAFSYRHFDQALEQAKRAEARFMKSGDDIRPLEGLPIAVKDAAYIKGMPTSSASLTMRDFVPDSTSAHVERILEAGGIIHARSTTPEFSCAAYCHSKLWGVTRNPWNLEFTPGGSSGGSGACLAAGTAPLASGSDIAGSIRIPASCCGVVGYKPPHGRNPVDLPFNLDPYCHTGPMARSLADAIMLQNVISGPHPQDIATLRPKLVLPADYQSIKGWKVAYSLDLGFFEADSEVLANTLTALEMFRDLGARVEEVILNWDWSILEAGLDHLYHIFGAWLADLFWDKSEFLTDYALQFCAKGRESRAADYVRSMEKAAEIYSRFGPMMERYNLFICPTTAIPAVPAGFNQAKDELVINGKSLNPILGWVMTTPFNTMGRCPALSLPSGRAQNGVPTGIQLVGRTYRDTDVFRAGVAYEDAVGGWFNSDETRPYL